MIIQIIIAVIFAQVFGFLWYGPLFGKAYGKVIGVDPEVSKNDPEAKKMMPKLMIINIILSIIGIIGLTWVFKLAGVTTVGAGIATAFIACIGFVLPIAGSAALWSGKQPKLARQMFYITFGYQLLAFIGYGIILGF